MKQENVDIKYVIIVSLISVCLSCQGTAIKIPYNRHQDEGVHYNYIEYYTLNSDQLILKIIMHSA